MPGPHNHQTSDPLAFLPAADPARQEQLAALWALTVEQRIARMYARQLTSTQLFAWAQRHPQQVPTLNGEFWFVAVHLADNE